MKNKRLPYFELQHLRNFMAVAENPNCSISEVAEELLMAQPNLSQQIKELEKKLKITLFDRKKRPLKLTKAGEAFKQDISSIFANLENAIENAQLINQGKRGQLIVRFDSSASNSILPEMIQKFRSHLPEVKLILQEHTGSLMRKALSMQEIDIGLMHWCNLYKEYEELNSEIIHEESLILVIPENHPLANESEISLKSLANECFILPPTHIPYSVRGAIIHFWEENGFVPKEIQEAILMLTIINLVAGGVGVALLPSNVKNIERKGVIYRTIKETTPVLQIKAFWHKDNSSPILKQFIEVIKSLKT
jgi:DNA-binding transcriptional LysR family regulator